MEMLTKSSFELQADAMQAWMVDRDLFVRSEESAAVLGAALIKVKEALPHGEYEPWIKASGISRNRAQYCVRKVNGKDKEAKDKAKDKAKSRVIDLKPGMLVRFPAAGLFRLLGTGSFDGTNLIFSAERAHETETAPETPIASSVPADYDGPPKVVFNVAELKNSLRQLDGVVANKAQEPAYANVRLTADETGVKLLGVGRDQTLTIKLPVGRAYGQIAPLLLDYAKLKSVVKNIKTVEASLTQDGVLEADNFKCSIETCQRLDHFNALRVVQAIGDQPDKELVPGYMLMLPELKEQIEQVIFAVPPPGGKFEVPSILIESTPDAFRLVATDGHVLAISSVAANLGEFASHFRSR